MYTCLLLNCSQSIHIEGEHKLSSEQLRPGLPSKLPESLQVNHIKLLFSGYCDTILMIWDDSESGRPDVDCSGHVAEFLKEISAHTVFPQWCIKSYYNILSSTCNNALRQGCRNQIRVRYRWRTKLVSIRIFMEDKS